MCGVKFYPGRCQHEIDMLIILKPPKLEHTFKIKLTDNLMSGEHGVHIGLEPQFRVHTLLIKFNLYEAVGVSPNDEIYFGPVYHNHFLYEVNNVGELLFCGTFQTFICLGWFELTV